MLEQQAKNAKCVYHQKQCFEFYNRPSEDLQACRDLCSEMEKYFPVSELNSRKLIYRDKFGPSRVLKENLFRLHLFLKPVSYILCLCIIMNYN